MTANPSTLSFGAIARLSASEPFVLTNNGAAAVTLAIAKNSHPWRVRRLDDIQSVERDACRRRLGDVTVILAGSIPAAGSYSGAVTVTGQNVSLRLPYLLLGRQRRRRQYHPHLWRSVRRHGRRDQFTSSSNCLTATACPSSPADPLDRLRGSRVRSR